MSMWSRLKVAVLSATVAVAALQFGGCLGLGQGTLYKDVLLLTAIGSIFD